MRRSWTFTNRRQQLRGFLYSLKGEEVTGETKSRNHWNGGREPKRHWE